jgi:tRNA threonylcarbamoyladenosine biosynthesis protein TsaE
MARSDSATLSVATGEARSGSPEATRDLGRDLGSAASAGTVLALIGPLGAGKTQLAKGVAEGLGVTTIVNSPTFVLMNEHQGRLRMLHVDAYRLDDPSDAIEAGLLDERGADGVVVVEWADRLAGWLPAERLEIALVPLDEGSSRALRWRALGAPHARLASVLADR